MALNRHDLSLMAQFCQYSHSASLFSTGLVEARKDQNGFWRPFIRFRTRPTRMCPFLQNDLAEDGTLHGLCGLHPFFKPLVCQLAPLGRIIDLQDNHEIWQIHAPSPGCPGMDRGTERNVADELAPWKQRLADEAEFFSFLEEYSQSCQTAQEAVERLFSFEIS